jgi:2-polyprenyl-3-methyl-5-hydroxy-6-metoxy-1,4-benzoquinol methylase
MTQSDLTARSNGYEAVASVFMAQRSPSIGVETVRNWASEFSPGATILDLGCAHGTPISRIFVDQGLSVYGVDASASMIAAIRRQLPSVQVECATIEDSEFFGLTFDGVCAWGLIFLLTPAVQSLLIRKVSRVLTAGGRFLFTAPKQVCEWSDSLTGCRSFSLGTDAYRRILASEGLSLVGECVDEGENHYFLAVKTPNQHLRVTGQEKSGGK